MTMNKDSPEVVAFMRLFGKLKDWSENDPESLPDLASTDQSIKDLCLELLKAAGSLKKSELGARDLFTAPVDSKFVSTWRDFEERFANALLVVLANTGEWQHLISFDWYEESPGWEDADYNAAESASAIETMIDFAQSQADENMKEAPTAERPNWVRINPQALSKEGKAVYAEVRKSRAAWIAARDKLFEEVRNELKICDDEARKSALNAVLMEVAQWDDDDSTPIEEAVKWAKAQWKSLKYEAGFDLRGVLRRRALVPFVLFPRHVAAHHGQAGMPFIYVAGPRGIRIWYTLCCISFDALNHGDCAP